MDFAVSCSAAARAEFQRAAVLLHSFWYDAAAGAGRAEILEAQKSVASQK